MGNRSHRADQYGDDLHPNEAGYRVMANAAFQRLFGAVATVAPGSAIGRPGTPTTVNP
jgi:hypothetical protein